MLAAALTSIPAEASILVSADDFISIVFAERDSFPPGADISISCPDRTDSLFPLESMTILFFPD
ncbi:hypothetical protein D3C73_1533950 [compost metagenome]